jgi:hypothetical protein
LYCTVFYCLYDDGDDFYQIRLWDENDNQLSFRTVYDNRLFSESKEEFARKLVDRFWPNVRIDWEESFIE